MEYTGPPASSLRRLWDELLCKPPYPINGWMQAGQPMFAWINDFSQS
jgi:hypothetical protein